MCGRIAMLLDYDYLSEQLEVEFDPEVKEAYAPRYNVGPTQWHWIVQWVPGRGTRVMQPARWGLINKWSKDRKWAARQINARVETVEEKPAFKESFVARRCVVPISGFYEWSGGKRSRHPYFLRSAEGEDKVLQLAGLWSSWMAPETGEPEQTFTVLTTVANETVSALHERMPVLLDGQGVRDWLNPESSEGLLRELMRPAAEGVLTSYPVDERVNSVSFEDPSCVERVAGPRQRSLF